MSMNPETKIVRQRMSVLELAEALGNVSEACRGHSSTSISVAFRRMVWKGSKICRRSIILIR